jgi:hypothetical protein
MSNKYFNFTAQKISPETKEKVQLQILLHDGSANTFHFNNPLGRETAIKRPGLVISTFGLAEIISCMPDGLVKKYIGY